jgi:hypothetical protein
MQARMGGTPAQTRPSQIPGPSQDPRPSPGPSEDPKP